MATSFSYTVREPPPWRTTNLLYDQYLCSMAITIQQIADLTQKVDSLTEDIRREEVYTEDDNKLIAVAIRLVNTATTLTTQIIPFQSSKRVTTNNDA